MTVLPIKLDISFDPFALGSIYQLVSLGPVRKDASGLRNLYLTAQFRRTTYERGSYQPELDGICIKHDIHLHQGASLHIGSLWQHNGEQLSPCPVRLLKENILNFSLDPGELKAVPLSTILPIPDQLATLTPLTGFLTKEVLRSLTGTPFVTVEYDSTTLIISCLELMRAFYFWAGPGIIDFFTYPGVIEDICRPLRQFKSGKKREVNILLQRRNKIPSLYDLTQQFTQEEVAILAELVFNKNFRNSFQKVQTSVRRGFVNRPAVHFWLDLVLDKSVKVKANGIPFVQHKNGQEKKFFWVCSLIERSNYFCFDVLKYINIPDHRTGNYSQDTSIPAKQGVIIPRASIKPGVTPVQNSARSGNESYSTEATLLTGDLVKLPSVSKIIINTDEPGKENKDQQALLNYYKKITYRQRYGNPTILSTRNGGRGLSVAKAHFHLDEELHSYSWYFKQIATRFGEKNKVDCLATPGATPLYKVPVWILVPETRPLYRAAVLQITYRKSRNRRCCFYFFQILYSHSKRSAFLFKFNLEALTRDEINRVLTLSRDANDSWSKINSTEKESLKRDFDSPISLKAHNHKTIEADVALCEKEMQTAFRVATQEDQST